ncbi:MAG: DUF2510 domain-containing protein, partial [Ilumatobacteraceae bacterium]
DSGSGSGASTGSGGSGGSGGWGTQQGGSSSWGSQGSGAGASGAASSSPSVPPGWYADPSSRFELRYWDGSAWTEHVSRSGQQYTDPPVA